MSCRVVEEELVGAWRCVAIFLKLKGFEGCCHFRVRWWNGSFFPKNNQLWFSPFGRQFVRLFFFPSNGGSLILPLVSSRWRRSLSLQQTLYLDSFPITGRAATQNYLGSILYLPGQTKGLGMLSEAGGRSLLRCPLTLTLPFSVSHNKRELKNATQNLNRPFSISDRSLENVLHLVTQAWSEARGFKFVWVCVQIGQLGCKAHVCVSGSMK